MTPCFRCWISCPVFSLFAIVSEQASGESNAVGKAGGPCIRSPAHARAPMGWRATIPSSTPWKAIRRCGKREWGLRPDTQTTCPAAGLVGPEQPKCSSRWAVGFAGAGRRTRTTPPASARSSIASSSRFQPRLAMSTSTKANCAGDVLRSFLVMSPSFAMAIGRLTGITATMP